MRTVYMLKSVQYPEQIYIGSTSDLQFRLREHNSGRSPHTKKYCPWQLVIAIQFSDKRKANAFERYLKTGSGRAFAKRHF